MSKVSLERNQRVLLDLVKTLGNDTCADCFTPNPRWALSNHAVFICVICAGIHRKLGTHISKVKSITFDTWTKEAVEVMRQGGNIKSNAILNPDSGLNPPPTEFEESERNNQLEMYIRKKYETRSFARRSNPAPSSSSPTRIITSTRIQAPTISTTRSIPPSAPSPTSSEQEKRVRFGRSASTPALPPSTLSIPPPSLPSAIQNGTTTRPTPPVSSRTLDNIVTRSRAATTGTPIVRGSTLPALATHSIPARMNSSIWDDMDSLSPGGAGATISSSHSQPQQSNPFFLTSSPSLITDTPMLAPYLATTPTSTNPFFSNNYTNSTHAPVPTYAPSPQYNQQPYPYPYASQQQQPMYSPSVNQSNPFTQQQPIPPFFQQTVPPPFQQQSSFVTTNPFYPQQQQEIPRVMNVNPFTGQMMEQQQYDLNLNITYQNQFGIPQYQSGQHR